MKIIGTMEVKLTGEDGKIKQHDVNHNLIVDAGFDLINTLMRTGGAASYPNVLGLVWEDPDVGVISLAAVDLDFQNYTNQSFKSGGSCVITKISDKSWKMVASWIATEPTPGASGWPIPVRGIGAYSAALANNIFSGVVRAPINKASADILEITYTFTMA